MIAFMLTALFLLAALAAIGVLADCALRARAAFTALKAHRRHVQPAGCARITVTSWRVVEPGPAIVPVRRAISPRLPAWQPQLAAAA